MRTDGELAGDVIHFLMQHVKEKGPEFGPKMISILTLCLSCIIEGGYCKIHYESVLSEVITILRSDLNLEKEYNDNPM